MEHVLILGSYGKCLDSEILTHRNHHRCSNPVSPTLNCTTEIKVQMRASLLVLNLLLPVSLDSHHEHP